MHGAGIIAGLLLMLLSQTAFADSWPEPVQPLELKPNKAIQAQDDLSRGVELESLAWAWRSSVACFPETQKSNFSGRHRLYGMSIPPHSVLEVELQPAPGVDLNLYAIQVGAQDFDQIPPKVTSCVTAEASYSPNGSNPGAAQRVRLNAIRNPYNVLVGVAGPEGVKSGSYTLTMKLAVRKEEPKVEGDVPVRDVAIPEGADTATVKGNLNEGMRYPIRWANRGRTACFPETQNQKFEGHHLFYRAELPAWSTLKIEARPAQGVDVNLYGIRLARGDRESRAHSVSSAVCEASYPARRDTNPGEAEDIRFVSGRNPYTILIGVAGPAEAMEGAFELKVEVVRRK